MQTVTVYETATRFYLVGSDAGDQVHRVLKIDRTTPGHELLLIEDEAVYSSKQIAQLLQMISDGNRGSGGLRKVVTAFGILGFVRFMEGHYMVLASKRSQVAVLGGHLIYHIDDTQFLPVHLRQDGLLHPHEQHYFDLMKGIDLNGNFYFSYTYDLTRTLQQNLTNPHGPMNDMFVWNHHLWKAAAPTTQRSPWILPVIHGFADQSKISVFGKVALLTLIARRSRHFAGPRFLKRGVTPRGYVANEMESEQIVQDASTTAFTPESLSRFAAYVQHRGSIPLYWSQESPATVTGIKPPIEIQRRDPFYSAGALHFDNMFVRYGVPIIVLNLVKQKEKTPRESLLLHEYTAMIAYLNQFLPREMRIRYIAWDMARAAKSNDEDVIVHLAAIAKEVLSTTGLFYSGDSPVHTGQQSGYFDVAASDAASATGGDSPPPWAPVPTPSRSPDVSVQDAPAPPTVSIGRWREPGELGSTADDFGGTAAASIRSPRAARRPENAAAGRLNDEAGPRGVDRGTSTLQSGIVRTNCVDCLDRTNAAQFMIAKEAFARQLHALGFLATPELPFDSDAVTILSQMYQDHGDTIALQYGGSLLVNTMDTYRRPGSWSSHSRDMINTLRRFYSNSFTDSDKQAAINLFLGLFIPRDGQPTIWELPNDFFLHHDDASSAQRRRSYSKWWTFDPQRAALLRAAVRIPRDVSWGRHFYEMYYEPRTLTTLEQTLLLTMNSTADRWSASPDAERNVASLSPFTVPANAPRTTFTFELGGNVRKLFAGVQLAASASSSTVALRVPSSASLSRIADAETAVTTGSYDALDASDAPDRRAAARVDASGGGEASSSEDAYQRGARIRAQLAVPFPVVQDADVAIYSRTIAAARPPIAASQAEADALYRAREQQAFSVAREVLVTTRRALLVDYQVPATDRALYQASIRPEATPMRALPLDVYAHYAAYVTFGNPDDFGLAGALADAAT